MERREAGDLDERELRAAQGAVAVLLLGAFVFGIPLLVVAITLIVAAGAALGARMNGFHAAYRSIVGDRLAPPTAVVAPQAARALDICATVLLLLACAAFAVGVVGIAWFFVMIEAAVATVAATTGYNAPQALLERMRRGP